MTYYGMVIFKILCFALFKRGNILFSFVTKDNSFTYALFNVLNKRALVNTVASLVLKFDNCR